MNRCHRKHLSVGVAVFDTFAGIEHCLFGFKHSHFTGYNGWELTGGKLDRGETLDQCAVRETLEETGLLIEPYRLNCFVEMDTYVCMMYAGRPIDGSLSVREPDKHREWRWFPVDQFPQPLIFYAEESLRVISEAFQDDPRLKVRCSSPFYSSFDFWKN
ncbi:MAG: NUDIX domain-containing protein [Candidatus Thorarchaeota archaeon]|jgi:8-oxo-dGTP diphosphatase